MSVIVGIIPIAIAIGILLLWWSPKVTALEQFLKYQLALEEEQPERLLYLAVPLDTYRSFFNLELPRLLIQCYQVRLIVFDPEEEAIIKWQK
ncbi:MAG: hypothetical protein HC862_31005 [Scytonema sp. RU_4_4]|nr:hypothetical protein [Scytonema sp. RU_4_4]